MLGGSLDKKPCLYRHEINAMHGAAPTKKLWLLRQIKICLERRQMNTTAWSHVGYKLRLDLR